MENLVKKLEKIYRGYGYNPYTMSKFEEYELYLRNKDFLISDRILTFTDTDGKLMALKPDVTLSIIKNSQDAESGIQKLFYRENVYRPGKSDQGFREIMQIGLECMDAVDTYCVLEVLLLAVKSLQEISTDCVLDVSHMGLLSGLLDRCGLMGTARQQALAAIAGKNSHELRRVCQDAGVDPNKLLLLTETSGRADQVIPVLESVFGTDAEFVQFKALLSALVSTGVNCVNVDFSVINDMKYYNGIVFRGFVEGVPTGVLSGGEYDALMTKMNRKGKAIGFALYPDLLDRLLAETQVKGVDAILVYDADADLKALAAAMDYLTKQNLTVSAQPRTDGKVYPGKVYELVGNEVKCIENDA